MEIIVNGHQFCTPHITVLNEAPTGKGVTVPNVKVKLTIPSGLAYKSHIIPAGQGDYNIETEVWTIPALLPNTPISAYFCFEVIDNCLFPFKVFYRVYSDEIAESDVADNISCIEFGNPQNISVCKLAAALAAHSDSMSCSDLGFPEPDCPDCPE